MPCSVISSDPSQLEYWLSPEDKSNSIKPLVNIGNQVHIESSSILHGGITVGDGSWIGSHVTIHDGARIGKEVKIFPGAVISAVPQDLKFHGERTTLEIGDGTTIRECATLNRGTDYHGKTVVGKNCLIMAYVHVAHDCIVGDNVVIANAVNMAGHVEIGDDVRIGGLAGIHQFVKIGKHSMISGGALVGKDVPPFVKAGRDPVQFEGVNSIGLRRKGFSNETIHQIQDIYRRVFLSGMNNSQALSYIEAHLAPTEERDEVITFLRNCTRGIIKSPASESSNANQAD
ncbi:MAG: acyl-ACP--UDP-N-acetylglucosamine O-acyltransferase [Bacteroidia bacterium]|nr:acyl-ACP--UDP-N-acetylglucosamine O-acyltransferase [Bacteroidia bacterium]